MDISLETTDEPRKILAFKWAFRDLCPKIFYGWFWRSSGVTLNKLILQDILLHYGIAPLEQVSIRNSKSRMSGRWIFFLLFVDFLFGQVVVSPVVTACWRSAWLTFDLIILGDLNHILSILLCVLGGLATHQTLQAIGPTLISRFAINGSRLRFHLVSKLFTVAVFSSSILHWKGWWDVCHLTAEILVPGQNLFAGLVATFGGVLTLAFLGLSRTNLGVSLGVQRDSGGESYFKKSSLGTNAIATVALSSLGELCTITSWFGVWSLQIWASDFLGLKILWQSATFSLVLGLTAGLVAFIIQFPILVLLDNTFGNPYIRGMSNQILSVFGLISSVGNLRGAWIILDLFAFPNSLMLSLSTCFVFGFLGLSLFGCVSSLHGGVVKDPTTSHEAFIMPSFYFTRMTILPQLQKRKGSDEQFLTDLQDHDSFPS